MKYEKGLIVRILIAILLAVLFKFYYILLAPVTMAFVGGIFKLMGYRLMINFSAKTITMACKRLDFIEACIAGSAYFLFSLLVVFTKGINLKKNIKLVGYGFLLILGMNVLRIIILILVLLYAGQNWFDIIHLTFWWFVGGIYIAIVWIFLTKKLKIKTIPVYSDIKELWKSIHKSKKRKKSKRKKRH